MEFGTIVSSINLNISALAVFCNFIVIKKSFNKLSRILNSSQRRGFLLLLLLLLVGTALETLGIGLVIPAMAILTQPDLAAAYPRVAPFLDYLGNPDQKTLILFK